MSMPNLKINVLYFGELRETVNTAKESLTLSNNAQTVSSLIEHLCQRGDPWHSALTSSEPLRIAVNQEMGNMQTTLSDGAEVAFFRPVTGG